MRGNTYQVSCDWGSKSGTGIDAELISKRLTLVQEDSQRNQSNGDDPENNILAALLFFFVSHSRQYTTPEIAVQVACEFPRNSRVYGFDSAGTVPDRLYPLNFTTSRTWTDSTRKCKVSSTRV